MLPLPRPTAPSRPPSVLDPAEVLTDWMATAGEDDLQPRLLRLSDGRLLPLPVARWRGPVGRADESMLQRCVGPVLDVGCGPGRLTAALHARGTEVLGLELLPAVPVLAREADAPLLLGDVFGPLPRTGQWQTVLLADGNVGIGGDPVRLLRRVHALLGPGGQALCELHPDGDTAAGGRVRLEGLGATSAWFPWVLLGRSGLAAAAAAARLAVGDGWEEQGRQFAALTRM
ncbi:MAG: class I SAM-dependent methyltransferase [Mycobacteriales bacterium]